MKNYLLEPEAMKLVGSFLNANEPIVAVTLGMIISNSVNAYLKALFDEMESIISQDVITVKEHDEFVNKLIYVSKSLKSYDEAEPVFEKMDQDSLEQLSNNLNDKTKLAEVKIRKEVSELDFSTDPKENIKQIFDKVSSNLYSSFTEYTKVANDYVLSALKERANAKN